MKCPLLAMVKDNITVWTVYSAAVKITSERKYEIENRQQPKIKTRIYTYSTFIYITNR